MKLDEVELTEDSPQEEVSQPKEEENKNEETQPMLDYDNIKKSNKSLSFFLLLIF